MHMTKLMAFGLALGLLCSTGGCSKSSAGDDSSHGSDTGGSAKNDNGGSATETNVLPIHCFEDADCSASGGTCKHFPGQDDGSCTGGKAGGPFHPGQGGDEDGGVVTPNTR
jgi:hypothetical protein